VKGNLDIVNYKRDDCVDSHEFKDVEELKRMQYKNTNIGFGVASSLISRFREHNLDTVSYRKEINTEIQLSKQILDNYIEQAENFKPDLVYVFNGRLSMYAPIVAYSKLHNIPFRVFEFTSRKEKYHIVYNTIPHDVDYEANDINRTWESNDNIEEKCKIGERFFEDTCKGLSLLEESFVSQQKKNQLPDFGNQEIISFFNSSIDEYASVPGWEKYIFIYKNEVDAIKDVCQRYNDDKTKQFVLRIHPNLKNLHNTQTKELEQLKDVKNLFIISSESPISSYEVLRKSSKIVTFGSTIGIEATYFRIPSILLGLGFHRDLDVACIPKSRDDLYALLNMRNLPPKPKENALKYGYWWLMFGVDFYETKGKDWLFVPKTSEQFLSFLMRTFSLNTIKRVFYFILKGRVFMIGDKRYKNSILRELFPWKER
jgi:hypothetical protein